MNVALRHLLSAACAAALLSCAEGISHRSAHERNEMRPEVVADLLAQVGHSWVHERIRALEGQVNDATALTVVSDSCGKITKSIVTGSNGDPERVREYMRIVCADSHGNKEFCEHYAAGIDKLMQGDLFFNREELDFADFCQKFYDGSLTDYARAEQAQNEKEEAERILVEKKRREAEENAAEEKRKATQRAQEKMQQEEEAKDRVKTAENEMARKTEEEKELAQAAARAAQLQSDAEKAAMQAAEAKVSAEKKAAEAKAKIEAEEQKDQANGTTAVNASENATNATVNLVATPPALDGPVTNVTATLNATAAAVEVPAAAVQASIMTNTAEDNSSANTTAASATNATPTEQATSNGANRTIAREANSTQP